MKRSLTDRIKIIALEKGLSIGGLERMIGASKGVLSKSIANGTDIQSKWLQKIADFFPDYSARWLLTGEGDKRFSLAGAGMMGGELVIPVVDITVAAGCGGFENGSALEEVGTLVLPRRMLGGKGERYCVRVRGESMAPTIPDSAYVVARRLERAEWEMLPDGAVCVLSDMEGHAYLKRVRNCLRQEGFVICMSDNLDKANYPNFTLDAEEINTLLRAELVINGDMSNPNDTLYNKVNSIETSIEMLRRRLDEAENAAGGR